MPEEEYLTVTAHVRDRWAWWALIGAATGLTLHAIRAWWLSR